MECTVTIDIVLSLEFAIVTACVHVGHIILYQIWFWTMDLLDISEL